MKEAYKNSILKFYRTRKRMPAISEIMSLCSLRSRGAAAYVANQLVREGIAEKDSTGRLIPSGKLHELRLLGNIKAGFAAPAEEELADTITVGEYLIGNKDASYMLQVDGDSMQDAGIRTGDMVIFERSQDYKPGDIVVALTEDGYTLKYLRKKAGKYYLEAANDSYPDIHPKEGQIIGIVTSTFRKYK
ncbi:MAG: polymerase subunit [Candidatus Parcubacteria bacterium]|nr:polymerase subunit [Candidatus Parcubacteria bacterium]